MPGSASPAVIAVARLRTISRRLIPLAETARLFVAMSEALHSILPCTANCAANRKFLCDIITDGFEGQMGLSSGQAGGPRGFQPAVCRRFQFSKRGLRA